MFPCLSYICIAHTCFVSLFSRARQKTSRFDRSAESFWVKTNDVFFSLMFSIDCFGMNGGNYLPSLSIHSQSHCLPSPSRISPRSPVSTSGSESGERYSRKVFVGGLPPDIDEGIVCFTRERLEFQESFLRIENLVLTISHLC
jgi:hypothetical protein